ncbi:MAG: long-chain fatty acid--CoA ligase [Alphaproteobacteria bacterium]|nr:long-chain fatty acid--CoA ligase [Alphaproteobacteria bacterium]
MLPKKPESMTCHVQSQGPPATSLHDGRLPPTLPAMLRRRIEEAPNNIAYRRFNARADRWEGLSWSEVGKLVARWQQALIDEGLAYGDRVGILLPNGLDWVACDQAALALGLVVVPLYLTDSPANWCYQLDHAGVRLVMIDQHDRWQRIAEQPVPLSDLQRVVIINDSGSTSCKDARLATLRNWLPSSTEPAALPSLSADDLATIIYTSGTTGRPKGVMLTHRNMLAAVDSVLKVVPAYADDVFLSYLPLAHVFERIMGYYLPIVVGAEVAFARSVETLRDDLQFIRPSVLLGVPRIYERIYAAVHQKFGRHMITRWLLVLAERIGWRAFEADQTRGPRPSLWQRVLWPLFRTLIATPILMRFGGRVRVLVSGGAHLSERVGRFMVSLGFPLLEGYGLTESAAPVTGNVFHDNVIGTVGKPLPGVELRIAENGELMVRAASVMTGYWRDPERTRAALTDDGWLHTGDLAEWQDGRIVIRGRLKELLVTSTGENIAPTPIEAAMAIDPMIDQALVVGDGKPFLAAIIVLNRDTWHLRAKRLGLKPDDALGLATETAKETVLAGLAKGLVAFPDYAQIRAVHLTLEPWTVENGLLTTTQKVRRHAIEACFADDIENLYRNHDLKA